MACYLCAYRSQSLPQQIQPLPSGSPAQPHDDLGTCWKCAVWACSGHGTLYSYFECARCTPSIATQQVLITGPTNPGQPAAAALAYSIGKEARPEQLMRMEAAVGRVLHDARSADIGSPHVQFFASALVEGNLVADLSGFIAARTDLGPRAVVPLARAAQRPTGELSIEAVAASVRATFAGVELTAEPTDEIVTTVMGALLMAEAVAHDPVARSKSVGGPFWPSAVEAFPPPWNVSHPGLLDPVMWLIGTAFEAES